ncbi:hypothetical protein Tcan_18685 [Toxocara canis]|uniref:Uncharacterized protein n=1 Tax=Toxocara canis TaxID=6265 RepID=A0A0B2URQ4_TOXCA|nr:hypothetical protein Tcan_18685 [Toxocara canis]
MSLVSNQCSVRDSSTMDECFELLQYAISSEVKETKTRFFSYDPLRELVDRLKEKLETCGWEVSEVSCEDLTQENVPSTSIAEGENENVIDTRIRFSALLNLLFDKLSSAVKQVSERSSDSTTVLSVERMATLTSALQFYVPTAILPYIDEGVTFAVEQRCTFVKYWQPLRVSNNFRKKQVVNWHSVLNEVCFAFMPFFMLVLSIPYFLPYGSYF